MLNYDDPLGISKLFSFSAKRSNKAKGNINEFSGFFFNSPITTPSKKRKTAVINQLHDNAQTKKAKEIIDKIGKESIYSLLQQSKEVAISQKDKEMLRWINAELGEYTEEIEAAFSESLKKTVRGYRLLWGKVGVQFENGEMSSLRYPLTASHSIAIISKWEKNSKNSNSISVRVTVPENTAIPEISGQTVDVLIDSIQLQRLIIGVEQTLSNFLETKAYPQ